MALCIVFPPICKTLQLSFLKIYNNVSSVKEINACLKLYIGKNEKG
jgi:hypothetical protein